MTFILRLEFSKKTISGRQIVKKAVLAKPLDHDYIYFECFSGQKYNKQYLLGTEPL